MNKVIERIREPSTQRGLVMFLTATGLAYSPEEAQVIVMFGVGIAGLIGIFTSDGRKK